MTDDRLPLRPRLGEHVAARHHVTADREIVVLTDARDDSRYEIEIHEWDALSCADGTRDFDGIALAAAARGSLRRISSLRAMLEGLADLGLLVPGLASPDPMLVEPPPTPGDRPLDLLPSFSLACDGGGTCCRMYGSVGFSTDEAERARAAARPDVPATWLFTPVRGSRPSQLHAVSLVSGACAFLDSASRCRLHAAAGPSAKPLVCRQYPTTFTDDGTSIRVSIGVECACIATSVGRPDGAPLLDPSWVVARDLPPGTRVLRLSPEIVVRAGVTAPREDLARWSRTLLGGAVDGSDAWLAFARITHSVERDGLAAIRDATDLPADLRDRCIEQAAAIARGARRSLDNATDRVHASSLAGLAWIAASTPSREDVALDRSPDRVESFYLRATLHGHFAVRPDVASAMRLRAARIVLARAMARTIGPAKRASQWFAHPIVAIEALSRALGISAIPAE
ncbi:MAG: YkgJ family cysteine cluster protein [Deltaproteobacteria bacterium]|nr:YkgJ family cysteine cluster protein [Deltaproteobacteria bacterium]